MRRRILVGVGVGAVFSALVLMPRASSPVDEAVRVLELQVMDDDEGWYTFRVNGKPNGIMYKTYMLPPEPKKNSPMLASYLRKKLEPLGWRRKRGFYTHFRGMELWTKGDTTVGYSIDPDKPYEHLIEFERKSSIWEELTARLLPDRHP